MLGGPRENDSRMDDWIRNRIIFILFYYSRVLGNLMRAIHEIAWGIYNSQNSAGYKNKLLTSVAITNQIYFSNSSAKRVSRLRIKAPRVSDVQRNKQNAFDLCFVSDF